MQRSPCLPGSYGGEVETLIPRAVREKGRSMCDQPGRKILRSVEISYRPWFDMGDAAVEGWIDVVHLASLDLTVFRGAMWRARDCQELTQREG